jgi:hypothetical protein
VHEPAEPAPTPADAGEPRPDSVLVELPSIRRELFVTVARAAIAVVAITVLVLVLTLIADWR